jgi:hypothetical protein
MFKKITIFTVITILALLSLSVLLSAWPYIVMYPLENTYEFIKDIARSNGLISPKFMLEVFSYHLKALSLLINLLWVLIGAYVAYKASTLAKRYLDIKEKERKRSINPGF